MKILLYGIYLVIFCLPLYLLRFKTFGIPITVLEAMIYALFVIWLINKFKNQLFRRSLKKLIFIFIPVSLILIGVSLATIFSLDLRTSAGIWKGWFIDPLLFFVVLVTTIKNVFQVKKVLYSLLLSGTAVAIISLIYLIQGKLDPFGRLQAFYNSPNYLAMYLAPILILGFGLWIIAKNWRERFLLSTFYFLFSICLFFTKSFGAWIGIAAAICFAAVFYLYKSNRKQFALTILYLALLIIVFLGYFALIQKESSFDARMIIWQRAWQVFKTNPILGIGPGTFGNYFPAYPEWGVPQPHNLYLAFLLQAGILGFVGFVWLLVWFFKTGIRNFQFSIFNFQLMSVMVYILVHGLVDTTYWKNDLAVVFWLIVGLMAVLKIGRFEN